MMKPPVSAVRGSGLSTTALPVASAGATARIDRISGKLNGEITPMTPRGTRRASESRPPSLGSIRPWGSVHIAADAVQDVDHHLHLESRPWARCRRSRA